MDEIKFKAASLFLNFVALGEITEKYDSSSSVRQNTEENYFNRREGKQRGRKRETMKR